MKRCPHCNAELADEARFCLYCMRELEKKETINIPKAKNKRKRQIAISVISIILIVAIITSCVLLKAPKLYAFDKFVEASIAATEKLELKELWKPENLLDIGMSNGWTKYHTDIYIENADAFISFYEDKKEAVAIIENLNDETMADGTNLAICITDGIVGNYLKDIEDFLTDEKLYPFTPCDYAYRDWNQEMYKGESELKKQEENGVKISSKYKRAIVDKINIEYQLRTKEDNGNTSYDIILYFIID